jgi:hypothetical protein
MKHLPVIIPLALVIFIMAVTVSNGVSESSKSGVDTEASIQASAASGRVYPIAPGVWYPQDGPIPEKPVRYYRARCWPGCHRGSAHGKYPEKPLNMEPIFPTSTVPTHQEKKTN